MIDTMANFSRRRFLSQASYFGGFYAMAGAIPLSALADSLFDDPRISATPVVDAGFASVRKIGQGAYATISDTSKGLTTMCNGGFVHGKDAALLLEGFVTANGAAFQMEVLRKVTQVPAAGALDTHYHFDHSCGNSFYGANGIQLWGHAAVGKRITENYEPMQMADKAAILGPLEKRVQEAKSDVLKQHAQSDFNALAGVVDVVKKTTLTLPNRPLDPAKLPLNVDLGGYPIVIESFPGHSGTDVIVRVPEQKVVYTGDLLFNGMYPVCFDEKATISGWRATLKTFASYDKDTIFVPGHGQVCGQEGIALLCRAFDDIAEQAEKMYKAGVPVSEAADQYVVPEKFKSLGIFAWGFTIGPAVTKLYAEWGGK
jgi:glyoxylase-like metal-dependent hydrolase (beta-lactamase superfamily II)